MFTSSIVQRSQHSRASRRAAAALVCAGLSGVACAQAVDPLALVPQAETEAVQTEPIGLRFELARDQFDRRADGVEAYANRAALDFRHQWKLGATWTLGLSDRLEQVNSSAGDVTRNALREAYVSHGFCAGGYLDAGRINWRNGVATGFNPTDFLKRGALVAQTTQNPQTLRENRLGAVMLRGQVLGALGSAQFALVPDLTDRVSTGAAAPAWDRTNGTRAALVKLAPAIGERTSLDLLAYARAGERPRFGVNMTRLIGDAWVVHAEWAGGITRPLAGPGEVLRDEGWSNAASAGLSWTTPSGLVLTLERQYAGDALTPGRWLAWRTAMAGPLAAVYGASYGAMRNARTTDQAPLTRDAWFVRAAWDDAFGVRDLDLAAITRYNSADHSRLWQGEAHWHLNDRQSLSAILGGYAGARLTEYGSLATRAYAELGWSFYF